MSQSPVKHNIINVVDRQLAMRCAIVLFMLVTLGGCAAGKLFMAGYQPPQTIADLLNEQYALAGEIPPNGIRGAIDANVDMNSRANNAISAQSYKGESQQQVNPRDLQSEVAVSGYAPAPVQRFRPHFTYKTVQDYAGQLAMDLIKNANGLTNNAAIGVTSFVKLDTSLQNTTILGNQMAEYSISEIQQFGLNVIDFKLMPAIQVTSNGDLAFSRKVQSLAKHKIMDHVLAATMIEKADGVFINARIIALHTNQVVSSASVLVPKFVTQQNSVAYLSLAK